jgi:hypothetical protein
MNNFLRQTEKVPGLDIQVCMEKWKDYSLDKLAQEEEKLQDIYFVMKENPSLEGQIRAMIENLQKYIQIRYKHEDEKNQKKINL